MYVTLRPYTGLYKFTMRVRLRILQAAALKFVINADIRLFKYIILSGRSRIASVGVENRLRNRWLGNMDSQQGHLIFSARNRPIPGTKPSSYSVWTGSTFSAGKAVWAWSSSLTSFEYWGYVVQTLLHLPSWLTDTWSERILSSFRKFPEFAGIIYGNFWMK